MAENFYARKIVTEADKATAIELINSNELLGAANHLLKLTKEWHICKLSGNYRHMFGLNPELYDINDLSSILKFLQSGEYEIYGEDFGTVVSPQEFIDEFYSHQSLQPDLQYGHQITKEGVNYIPSSADDWF